MNQNVLEKFIKTLDSYFDFFLTNTVAIKVIVALKYNFFSFFFYYSEQGKEKKSPYSVQPEEEVADLC